jgi:two-component system, chemotaxis family, CheB/CheR fusion protein
LQNDPHSAAPEKAIPVRQLSPEERVAELEAELDASRLAEKRLRAFLEFAAQGVIAVDSRGRIAMVNRKTEEMFGYTRQELLGQGMEMLLPERYRGSHSDHRKGFFAQPRTRPMGLGMDLSGARKDGSEFPLEISLSYVDEGGSRLALAFITDITERKRLDEQLRHTQKLESLGVLAGGVAHDFNNLLTGIMGNASLSADSVSSSHPVRPFLDQIIVASQRAADLTRQLLAYAGKGRFVVSEIDLSELVREISGLIEASIPKTVQLRLDLQERIPPVEGDASQIQQLVMNIIINAAEAIGENVNGSVLAITGVQHVDADYARTLRSEGGIQPGKYVFVEVNDTGKGMDEETLARIFDPFFTTKFTGRGLGLAAASGIVRGHRGAIKVYSTPGKGTTFRALFPVAAGERRTDEGAESRADLSGSGLVLVVDDEAIVRQTAKAALQRYGYTVLSAEDGQSAVDLFRQMSERISVVLLDLTMPGLSGEETLRNLQSIRPDVRVVLTSGYHESEAIRRFTGKGLAGFIQKPYTAAQLAELIKTAAANGPG